jgi:hypothetical protein
MNPLPPKDWVGEVDEQRELWVQIFAYYTLMQHLEDGKSMSYFRFCNKLPAFKMGSIDKHEIVKTFVDVNDVIRNR